MNGFNWKTDLQRWLSTCRDISPELANSIVTFFELAFEHTRCPQRAWFGIHPSRVSLVVGGIYLAAIQRSGQDQGLWLLLDQQPPPIKDIAHQPVKSTQKSKYPLVWAHSVSLAVLPALIASRVGRACCLCPTFLILTLRRVLSLSAYILSSPPGMSGNEKDVARPTNYVIYPRKSANG